ncbi:MAG TPA: zinc-dependent alcohol dehydrogenase family protein [Clostridiaceae bacterium]|nr:zinc-dependent alcohol dehydrogenase family protein [Clostridiaceae bacterium]
MKAMVLNRFGGPEVFELAEVPVPEVRPGYVLAKVHASSFNPLEVKIRSGLASRNAPPMPAILGTDFSGEIVKVGEGVTRWKEGDEVFGCAGGVGILQGAFAEYVLADERLIARKPQNIDHETAALYPLVTVTAWEAIMENPYIRKGDKVLVHGASGGVGHIVAQLAKILGAEVHGTVTSKEKGETAKAFGTEHVIVVPEEPVEIYTAQYTYGKGFDAVIDTVGGPNLANSFEAAKLWGTVCTTNARVTLDLSLMHQKALTLRVVFMALPMIRDLERERQGRILEEAAKLIEEGKLKISRDSRQFSFEELGKAHIYYESHSATGKISLVNRF